MAHGFDLEGLFRGPPAAHGYDTPEVRKMEDAKVGTMAGQGPAAGPRADMVPTAAYSFFLAEGEIISIEPKADP